MLSSTPTSPPPGGQPGRPTPGTKLERPPRICNVATKCVSREDFLRSFAPFVEENTLFIPTKLAFELGQLVRFQVALADGTVVLAGIGEATELLTGPTGPLGKSGVRFTIKDIDEPSRALRDELAARRRRALAAGVGGAGVGGAGAAPGEPARMTKTINGIAPSKPVSRPFDGVPVREPPIDPLPRPPLVPVPPSRSTTPAGPRPSLRVPFDDRPVEPLDPGPMMPTIPVAVVRAPDPMEFDDPAFSASEPLEDTREDVRADVMVHAAEAEMRARYQSGQGLALARVPEPLENPDLPPAPHLYEPIAPAGPPSGPQAALSWDQDVGNAQTLAFARAPAPPPLPDPPPASFARESASQGVVPRASSRHAATADRAPVASEEVRPARRRRVAPLALAAGVGLLVAFVAWMRINRPSHTQVAVNTSLAAPAPPAQPAPPIPVAEPIPAADPGPPAAPAARAAPAERPRPAESEAAPSAPVAQGPRNCRARIESQPRGAIVTLGRITLGRTPLARTAVPCGAASVTLTHPRYLPATVALEAGPDAPVSVSARLSRPVAQLQLSSAPAGAMFKVNGNRVGRGPRTVTVSRFETVRVEARLPGQKPWRQKIYLKDPVTDVQAAF